MNGSIAILPPGHYKLFNLITHYIPKRATFFIAKSCRFDMYTNDLYNGRVDNRKGEISDCHIEFKGRFGRVKFEQDLDHY